MLDSTLEMITRAASNSIFVFCFCNLIIIMILMGSKPAASGFSQESQIPLTTVTNEYANVKQATLDKHSVEGNVDKMLIDTSKLSDCEEQEALTVPDSATLELSVPDSADEENGIDKDDDELKRRVEEFIDKVNREWRAELLGKSRLH